ncbi:MAG: hypothetical protein GKS07_07675 [Nitrosopumilus sp.]|nr:MAG: hypothetical protein GKS07_07675 [Nitrosopumilus sp.]
MKTRLLIITTIMVAVVVILALTVKTKPFDDYPENHVEELKQIPEISMFYEKYGDYGVSVFPDGAYSYEIGFQSGTSQDQWIMLKTTYHFGIPTDIFVHCTPNGIQSQYTVRGNVLEYLSEENCFDVISERLNPDDDFEETFGGPGNRHPAFWGFDIPQICTENMIKHLIRYSSMFDRDVPYSLEWISMDDSINADDFDKCVEELLERNPKELKNENIFHEKSLSYWKNLDGDSLVQYYENFRNHEENFFDGLGVFLIKSHSEEKLLELGIVPAHEIEVDWSGIIPSLPPRMGFDAKVNSTDGKSYRITGTINGNIILDNFRIAEDNERRIGWTPAFEYSGVQISGTAALQVCSIMEITCIENPVWDAIHHNDKDFTFFHYDTYGVEPDVQIGEHYIQIDKDQVCHSFEDLLSQQISELECVEIGK